MVGVNLNEGSMAYPIFFQNGVQTAPKNNIPKGVEVSDQEILCLKIQSNVQLDQPIRIIFHQDIPSDLQSKHVILQLEKNAHASVSFEYHGENVTYQRATKIEIQLAAGAELECYELQRESMQCQHSVRMHVQQKENSRFFLYQLQIGCAQIREDILVTLEEKNAQADCSGLYILREKQKMVLALKMNHLAQKTRSEQYYKGILFGESEGTWDSRVHVYPAAAQSISRQKNQNLVLSRGAIIHTKPELEIDHDDVSCAHGATIGNLDEEAFFYLRSRGIPEKMAYDLLIEAFTIEMLERFKNAELKICFRQHLDALPI